MIEYSYFVEIEQTNQEFKQLNDVKSLNLETKIDSFYKTLKLRVSNRVLLADYVGKKCIKLTLKYQQTVKESFFILDEIIAVDKEYSELFCKSEGYLLETTLLQSIEGGTIKDALADSGLKISLKNDFFINGIQKEESNLAELIKQKCQNAGINFYVKDEVIVFESEFYIHQNGLVEFNFFDYTIISLSLNLTKNSPIKNIIFNAKDSENIYSKASLTMVIDPSPQPCSPDEDLLYFWIADDVTLDPASKGTVFTKQEARKEFLNPNSFMDKDILKLFLGGDI